jgi:hypothetical protein
MTDNHQVVLSLDRATAAAVSRACAFGSKYNQEVLNATKREIAVHLTNGQEVVPLVLSPRAAFAVYTQVYTHPEDRALLDPVRETMIDQLGMREHTEAVKAAREAEADAKAKGKRWSVVERDEEPVKRAPKPKVLVEEGPVPALSQLEAIQGRKIAEAKRDRKAAKHAPAPKQEDELPALDHVAALQQLAQREKDRAEGEDK